MIFYIWVGLRDFDFVLICGEKWNSERVGIFFYLSFVYIIVVNGKGLIVLVWFVIVIDYFNIW